MFWITVAAAVLMTYWLFTFWVRSGPPDGFIAAHLTIPAELVASGRARAAVIKFNSGYAPWILSIGEKFAERNKIALFGMARPEVLYTAAWEAEDSELWFVRDETTASALKGEAHRATALKMLPEWARDEEPTEPTRAALLQDPTTLLTKLNPMRTFLWRWRNGATGLNSR